MAPPCDLFRQETTTQSKMSTMEIDREQFILRAALKMGIDVLKEKQKEAIGAFLEGNDVFLTVPTGYGKSLVYGIIPFAFDIMRGKVNYLFQS